MKEPEDKAVEEQPRAGNNQRCNQGNSCFYQGFAIMIKGFV
ncbi:hypothetical protein [Mucilaginibacter corticis]|nr:hypothetical protein [Mucilaginibacter corticis]